MSEQQNTTPTSPVPNQHRPHYEQKILEILKQSLSPTVLQTTLADYHDNDIAEALMELEFEQREKLLNLLSDDQIADIIPYFDEEEQAEFLNYIDIKKTLAIVSKMDSQEAYEVLKKLSSVKRKVIMDLLPQKQTANFNLIDTYGQDEIGAEMATDFIAIPRNFTIRQAMRTLRDQARASHTDNLSILYVVDENGLYYGAIRIQDLFAARADTTTLEDIIEVNFPIVYGTESIEDLAEELRDYDEDSIPVLNNYNVMEGVITRQHLLEILDQQFSEDYVKLAGLFAEEDLEETVGQSMAKRTPWLLLLLFLSLFVSGVISAFEGVVAKLTIAIVFQSLILDMSGNVGTQSLAVSIRVLADPDVTGKQKRELILKETRTGFANGIIIGTGTILVLGIFIHFMHGYIWSQAYAIALCIGISMIISMTVSSFTGTVIPIAFQHLKRDPAAASGPLITTVNDFFGATIYYGMIWLFLIQMLHL